MILFLGCYETGLDDKNINPLTNDCRHHHRIRYGQTDLEPLHRPYRIHIQDQYFFVCDKGYGIHIFDFSNKQFIQVALIELPGNTSFTVKGDYLYADNCDKLVIYDISNPREPRFVSQHENVMFTWPDYIVVNQWGWEIGFSEENGFIYSNTSFDDYYEVPTYFYGTCEYKDPQRITYEEWYEKFDEDDHYWYYDYYLEDSLFAGIPVLSGLGDSPQYTGNAGGSMASFLLVKDYLYVITAERNLKILKVDNPQDITEENIIYGWDYETIYPFGNYAFMGGMSGMYIYDISDPANPEYISAYSHLTVCDPVVVQGDYAYVTLRSEGNWCMNELNQLDIIDISNIYNPTLVSSYTELDHPYGLGVDGDTVWVCDGSSGLKILDVADKENISLLGSISDMDLFDIIPYYQMLFLTGKSGIYLFDYSEDPSNPSLLSELNSIEDIY